MRLIRIWQAAHFSNKVHLKLPQVSINNLYGQINSSITWPSESRGSDQFIEHSRFFLELENSGSFKTSTRLFQIMFRMKILLKQIILGEMLLYLFYRESKKMRRRWRSDSVILVFCFSTFGTGLKMFQSLFTSLFYAKIPQKAKII